MGIIGIAQREADRAYRTTQGGNEAKAEAYYRTVTATRQRGHKAEEILAAGGISPNGRAGSYYVQSQSGNGRYTVDLLARQCDCPDHQRRGTYCKHLQAAELFAETEEPADPFAVDWEALGNEPVTSQYRDSLDAAGIGYGGRWTEGTIQDYIDYCRDV